MTDNLRDRIAAVLYERHYRLDGHPRVRLDLGFDALEPEIMDVYLADADAVIAVMGEANDDIRPALREALASWGDEKLSLDQTFELHERGCVCDDCLPDDID